jgi:hypothetical protein
MAGLIMGFKPLSAHEREARQKKYRDRRSTARRTQNNGEIHETSGEDDTSEGDFDRNGQRGTGYHKKSKLSVDTNDILRNVEGQL